VRRPSERGKPDLVGVGSRQGDLDVGDHLGDAPGDLDQAEADRIELSVAPERCGDSAGFAIDEGKPVHVAFDGGQMTSDTGILLIADGKETKAGAAALLDVDPVTLRRALRASLN